MLLLATSARAATGLNMIVSRDAFPTFCSLDKPSRQSEKQFYNKVGKILNKKVTKCNQILVPKHILIPYSQLIFMFNL